MDIELIKRMMDACYQGKRIRDMLPPLPDGVASSFIQYLDIIEKLEKQGIRVSSFNEKLFTTFTTLRVLESRFVTELIATSSRF